MASRNRRFISPVQRSPRPGTSQCTLLHERIIGVDYYDPAQVVIYTPTDGSLIAPRFEPAGKEITCLSTYFGALAVGWNTGAIQLCEVCSDGRLSLRTASLAYAGSQQGRPAVREMVGSGDWLVVRFGTSQVVRFYQADGSDTHSSAQDMLNSQKEPIVALSSDGCLGVKEKKLPGGSAPDRSRMCLIDLLTSEVVCSFDASFWIPGNSDCFPGTACDGRYVYHKSGGNRLAKVSRTSGRVWESKFLGDWLYCSPPYRTLLSPTGKIIAVLYKWLSNDDCCGRCAILCAETGKTIANLSARSCFLNGAISHTGQHLVLTHAKYGFITIDLTDLSGDVYLEED